MNVLTLAKDGEAYVFHFDSLAMFRETCGRFASDPELSFTWYDAAVLSQRARRMKVEGE